MNLSDQVAALEKDWAENPRWKHVKRPYTAEEVVKLRGSLQPECTLARKGAEKLWNYLFTEDYINCLGALTGGQAVQQVKAGVKACQDGKLLQIITRLEQCTPINHFIQLIQCLKLSRELTMLFEEQTKLNG